MRIAIIDDEKPARSELKYLVLQCLPEAEITEISSGEEALEVFSKESFDLLLIDINLGDISGTILASTVHKLMPEAEIVFATAYNTYADKAFEVDAMYYLLKPYSEDKVRQMVERYNNRHKNLPETPSLSFSKIPLNLDKKTLMMDVSDVVYIESQNRVCVIHTINGDYQDNNTLNYFEERLLSKGFFRIQKSYLVNLNHVKEMYPWFNGTYCIKMSGYKDDALPVSRKKIKHLKDLLCI
ncbi:MAG: LytTR family transcriptional regulator DNA-binding domain-containing protein [Clostridiaceae bacterium]